MRSVTTLAYSMRSAVYCIHTLMATHQESVRTTSLFLPPSDGPMMKSGTPTEVFIVVATGRPVLVGRIYATCRLPNTAF